MVSVKIKILSYESMAGEKVNLGDIIDLPDFEAERAVVCNVADYVEEPEKIPVKEETKKPEPVKSGLKRESRR